VRRSVDAFPHYRHRRHPFEPFRRTKKFATCLNISAMIEKRPYSSNFPTSRYYLQKRAVVVQLCLQVCTCSGHVGKSRTMPRAGSINSGQYCCSSVAPQGGSECPFTQSRKRITSNTSIAPHERQTSRSTLATPHDSPVHQHSQQHR
jgi:hypothetical protein